jgi:hypothetical protein
MAGPTVVPDSKAKEEEAKQSKEKRSRHGLRDDSALKTGTTGLC